MIHFHLITLRTYHLLTEFFSILHALPSNHLLTDTFNISIPTLAIAKSEFKARVARDEKLAFDMLELINATKEDEKMYESPTQFVYNDLVNSWIKNDTEFDIFNWTTWVLLLTFILAIFAAGSTIILHQRYKVIMLAMTTHKVSGLSVPTAGLLTYTRPTITSDISSDAFAYVTNVLSSILPSELTLLIVTILLLILIIGSWIIYRFNQHYYSKTRLILRIFANTAFEQQITTLRYTPDCYRITIVSNEFTIMNTCGKSQANFGSLFTVYDLISQEFLSLPLLITIFPWSARRVHEIINDRNGFGICLLVTDTRGVILDVIAI